MFWNVGDVLTWGMHLFWEDQSNQMKKWIHRISISIMYQKMDFKLYIRKGSQNVWTNWYFMSSENVGTSRPIQFILCQRISGNCKSWQECSLSNEADEMIFRYLDLTSIDDKSKWLNENRGYHIKLINDWCRFADALNCLKRKFFLFIKF